MSAVVIVCELERKTLMGIIKMDPIHRLPRMGTKVLWWESESALFGSAARGFGLHYTCCLYCLPAFAVSTAKFLHTFYFPMVLGIILRQGGHSVGLQSYSVWPKLIMLCELFRDCIGCPESGISHRGLGRMGREGWAGIREQMGLSRLPFQ